MSADVSYIIYYIAEVCLFVCLLSLVSQTAEPIRMKYSVVSWNVPVMVTMPLIFFEIQKERPGKAGSVDCCDCCH